MAMVAAANVLLVAVSRLVEASAPAAVIVSNPLVTDAPTNPLVIAVVGNPLVIASVAAASVLLVLLTKAAVARAFVPVMSSFSAVAPASVLLRVSAALIVSSPLVTLV